jgi:hypothetical protein
LPPSVTYFYRSNEGGGDSEYVRCILGTERLFDVVVVDGVERIACAKNAVKALAPSGVILWDNFNNPRHEEGYAYLVGQGFKKIDFIGMAPLSAQNSATTFFYREDNCLGI